MQPQAPAILLCDLDAFFAAVEVLDRPELAGRPVVVGGNPAGRGVVATCTYEARRFGLHSGMPMAQALRRCPQAVVLPVRKDRYKQLGRQVLQIYRRFTPLVEAVSIDEAYLDLGAADGMATARAIRGLVRSQLGLAVTIGVSVNKLLAKIACGLAKPDGLGQITQAQARQTLAPLPVKYIPGVGPKTAAKLAGFNIRTIGQLQQCSHAWLVQHFGRRGSNFYEFARGRDHRRVGPAGPAQSLSEERTLATDQPADTLLPLLMQLVQKVGYRLRQAGLRGSTVSIKVRYPDFRTVTRSYTVETSMDSDAELFRIARYLYSQLLLQPRQKKKPFLRLLGVQVAGLTAADGPVQASLWDEPQLTRGGPLSQVVDDLRGRFGSDAITRGAALTRPDKSSAPPHPE